MKPLFDGSLQVPEISGKCKSTPTKTNNLIYIMVFFQGGGVKKILGGGKKKFRRIARHILNIYPPPLQNPYLRPCGYIKIYKVLQNDCLFDIEISKDLLKGVLVVVVGEVHSTRARPEIPWRASEIFFPPSCFRKQVPAWVQKQCVHALKDRYQYL